MTVTALEGLLAAASVDVLGPDALSAAAASGDHLEGRSRALDPGVETARRLIAAPGA